LIIKFRFDSKNVLALILLFGLAIRLVFFTGYISAVPQDEGMYLGYVLQDLDGKYLNHFKYYRAHPEVLDSETLNPARTKPFSIMMVYPVSFFMRILGVSNFSACLYSLLASIGGIYVIYEIGKTVFDEKTGLISAFLLSIFPLNVFHSARIQIDVPSLFFLGLSIMFFLKAELKKSKWSLKLKKISSRLGYILAVEGKKTKKRSRKKKTIKLDYKSANYFLAGVSAALAYLIVTRSILIVIFYALYSLKKLVWEKRIPWDHAKVVAGFITVFIFAGIFFQLFGGDFFLSEKVRSKANAHQYAHDRGIRSIELSESITVMHTQSKPFQHIKTVFRKYTPRKGTDYFGYFYYGVAIALAGLVIKWDKRLWIILLWLIPLYLFLEFGAVGVDFNSSEKPSIIYKLMFKRERYIMPLTMPALLLLGRFLSLAKNRITKTLAAFIILFLLASSIEIISNNRDYFNDGVIDLKDAARFMKKHPEKTVYIDHTGLRKMQFLDYNNKNRYKPYDKMKDITSIRDAYIIDGGARSKDLHTSAWDKNRPKQLDNPPTSWQLIEEYQRPHHSMRKQNMKIYYTPSG